MLIRTAAQGPMIFAFVFPNRQVIDAGNAPVHITLLVKFPVLISVRAKPISGIIMPFVSKSNRDPVASEGP